MTHNKKTERVQGVSDALDIIEERRNELRGDENVKFEFDRLIKRIKERMEQ